jgi:phage-related protein
MKTIPIRCRLCDTRPIRAIAYEATPDEEDTNKSKQRDPCPTLKFFKNASETLPDSWADLANTLDEVAKSGPPKNDVKFGFLQDGIYEFKAWKLRIACFFDENMIICTHGFYKKQQKTPKGELETAVKKRSAYEKAKREKNLTHVQPAQQTPRPN